MTSHGIARRSVSTAGSGKGRAESTESDSSTKSNSASYTAVERRATSCERYADRPMETSPAGSDALGMNALRTLLIVGTLGALFALPSTAALLSGGILKTAMNATLKKQILVDGRGRTIYVFLEDKGMTEPQCVGNLPATGCGKEWPPVHGPLHAGSGVRAALLGTSTRADGKVQATYAKLPLY